MDLAHPPPVVSKRCREIWRLAADWRLPFALPGSGRQGHCGQDAVVQARNIFRARRELGLSQAELARRTGFQYDFHEEHKRN